MPTNPITQTTPVRMTRPILSVDDSILPAPAVCHHSRLHHCTVSGLSAACRSRALPVAVHRRLTTPSLTPSAYSRNLLASRPAASLAQFLPHTSPSGRDLTSLTRHQSTFIHRQLSPVSNMSTSATHSPSRLSCSPVSSQAALNLEQSLESPQSPSHLSPVRTSARDLIFFFFFFKISVPATLPSCLFLFTDLPQGECCYRVSGAGSVFTT